MEVYIETHQEVEIKITGKEASWLKGYIQNTMNKDEDSESVRYRKELFTVLINTGVK